jgi:hypothetical protein
MPLLVIDAALDIAFFGSLSPLVVPCCMVVYANTVGSLFSIGCPFCFITYKYPLLWGVIGSYAVSIALIAWSFLFQRLSVKTLKTPREISPIIRKVLILSIILAVLGTALLLIQLQMGAFSIA